MPNRISLLVACVILTSVAYAGDLYRWVDENGITQFSDTVPARYKGVATKIDTSASKVSESRRQEALRQAAEDKKRADANEARLKVASDQPDAAKDKPVAAAGSDDCAQLMQAYRDSQACFAPYRTANAGMKDEAFSQCKVVPDPSPKCGAPTN